MNKFVLLLLGVAAWAGVALVAVLAVNAWEDNNQVLAFVPIAAVVIIAWAIGEFVTERVFLGHEEVHHGDA
jgi:hypothetical protein